MFMNKVHTMLPWTLMPAFDLGSARNRKCNPHTSKKGLKRFHIVNFPTGMRVAIWYAPAAIRRQQQPVEQCYSKTWCAAVSCLPTCLMTWEMPSFVCLIVYRMPYLLLRVWVCLSIAKSVHCIIYFWRFFILPITFCWKAVDTCWADAVKRRKCTNKSLCKLSVINSFFFNAFSVWSQRPSLLAITVQLYKLFIFKGLF